MHLERALQWLERSQSRGGWGYLPGGTVRSEPTLYACAAGFSAPDAFFDVETLEWGLLLAPAALSLRDETRALRERLIQEVLATSGRIPESSPHLDASLQGWPWYPDSFSWIEPTSFGAISLIRNGHEGHHRVQQARAIMRDRVCSDGGWNYGNDFIFGKQLVSFHHSTAWVLMALPKGDPLVGPALKRLEHVFSQPSTLGLATAALAVAFQGKDPTRWIEVLKSRQDSDGSFGGGRVDRTALAAVALRMHQDRVSPFTGEVDWQPTHGVDHE